MSTTVVDPGPRVVLLVQEVDNGPKPTHDELVNLQNLLRALRDCGISGVRTVYVDKSAFMLTYYAWNSLNDGEFATYAKLRKAETSSNARQRRQFIPRQRDLVSVLGSITG